MKFLSRWIRSKPVQAVVLGLVSGALVLGAVRLGAFVTIEHKTLDWRFRRFTQQGQASRDIVIVAIDDASFQAPAMIENFGRWPWRRQLFAILVNYLHRCGAKVIGIDLTFEGRDAHQGDDDLLARQLAEKRDVILGMGMTGAEYHSTDPALRRALDERLAPYAWQVEDPVHVPVQTYRGVDISEPLFVNPSAGLGSMAIEADPDGPTRTQALLQHFGTRAYAGLALAMAAQYLGSPHQAVFLPGPALEVAGRRIPLDADGRMLIHWRGGTGSYPQYSVWKVYNAAWELNNGEKPEIASEVFRDKIVIIGATATGVSDLHANPFSPTYPGPELHATVIDNLIQGDFMREAPRSFEVAAILGLALLTACLVYGFDSALTSSVTSFALGFFYFAAVCYAFERRNLWMPMTAPLSAGVLAFLGATLTRYVTEGREKSRYRKTLMKYVSPALVETIMSDFDWASLRAEKKRLTVLFSDVRGFTTFSEKYPAETVIATLNEHLNMMVSVIFKYQGTLDKFVGDCVMAFWGAPLAQPNHAELAARAALEMIAGLEKLNEKWQSEGRPTLHIGVGINTGDMLFGNIGSEQRMDFTVIGDAVNLGSRLESSTKELHASIVISEATYREIEGLAQVRPLGEISVKGKAQKVVVYELLGMGANVPAKQEAAS